MNSIKLFFFFINPCLSTTQGFTEQVGSWFVFNGFWYQSFNIKTLWSDAQVFCEQLDAFLVTFYSTHYFDIVRKSGHFNSMSFWVGLEKKSESWNWIGSKLKVEPGNLVGNAEHIFYDPKQASYVGASNNEKHAVVCQKKAEVLHKSNCDTNNGWLVNDLGCFKKFELALTWFMSQEFCQAYGAGLAEINNKCRNDFLVSLLSNDETWIGLYRPHQKQHKLAWISGSDVTYNNIEPDFKRNRLRGTNYFYFVDTSGMWFQSTDQIDTQLEKRKFICQKMLHKQHYFIHKKTASWHEAVENCNSNGQVLAEILNQNDQEEINRIGGHAFFGWIGLSDLRTEGAFLWNSKRDYLYTNLKNVQSKGCVVTYANTSVWKSKDCQSRYYYICEVKTPDQPKATSPCQPDESYFDENCYYKSSTKNTWYQSQMLCETRNMNLASILTQHERNFVTNNQFHYVWLGAKYYGAGDELFWIDGHKMEFSAWKVKGKKAGCVLRTFLWVTVACTEKSEALCKGSALGSGSLDVIWSSGEPNNNKGNEYCVKMKVSGLFDGDCTTLAYPICKRNTRVTPITYCNDGWIKFDGFCYKYQLYDLWGTAQLECENNDSKISSILSKKEEDFISLLTNSSYIWLGATFEDNQLKWIDGQTFNYSNFLDVKINNTDDCLVKTVTGWRKTSCDTVSRRYVCKMPVKSIYNHCGNGLHWNGSCYRIHSYPRNWEDAKKECESNNSILPSVLSLDENGFLTELFNENLHYWVGAENVRLNNTFYWIDGSGLVTWSNWHPTQPDGGNSNKHCLAIQGSDGEWFDYGCETAAHFVCKWSPDATIKHCENDWLKFNDECYFINTESEMTMADAENDCVSKKSHLVSIHSDAENSLIAPFASSSIKYWIGLTFSGNRWSWTDGSPMEYFFWGSNATFQHSCGYMTASGWLGDRDCNTPQHYVCKSSLMRKVANGSKTAGLARSPIAEQMHGSWKWYSDFGNKKLIHLNISLKWYQAAQFCEDLGGHLLKNKIKMNNSFFLKYTGHWVGFKYKNHTILWSDGSVGTDVNWALKPNMSVGCGVHAKCGIQVSDCNAKKDFICYREDNTPLANSIRWKNVSGAFMYLSSIKTEFITAKRICTAADAMLTEIVNDCIYSDLLVYTEPMFIGLKKVNNRWSSSSFQRGHRYLDYWPTAFISKDHDCIVLHNNGSLEAVSCESKHRLSCLRHPERYKPSACGGCPWKPFNGTCYINIEGKFTWQESQKICQAYDGHLPVLDQNAKLSFLNKLSFSKRFWIVQSSNLSCSLIVNGNHKPQKTCNEKASIICERSVGFSRTTNVTCNSPWIYNDNSCYLFSEIKATWSGAVSICRGFKGSLTSIRSEKENVFISNLVESKRSSYFIGLSSNTNKKSFTWTDGTFYNYTKIHSNHENDDKQCVLVESSGEWFHEFCENSHYFVCNRRNVFAIQLPTTAHTTTSVTPTKNNYYWTEWSNWQPCDVFCGNGNQTRTRSCKLSNPSDCSGSSYEQRECEGIGDCSGYKVTKAGSSCTSFCEQNDKVCDTLMQTGGTVELFVVLGFICNHNQSQKDWKVEYAPYYDIETSTCVGYDNMPPKLNCSAVPPTSKSIRLCKCVNKDDVQMLGWSPWSSCSGTCEGHRLRTRSCALNTGMDQICSGATVQSETCNAQLCPVHGGFTMWSNWGDCSTTCGNGYQKRSRNCSNPLPMNRGLQCVGSSSEEKTCGVRHCPIHGGWTQWSDVSACTKPCNNGFYIQRRYCSNPKPLYGGNECEGPWNVTKPCNDFPCKEVDLDVRCKFQLLFLQDYKYSTSSDWQHFQNNLFTQVKESIGLSFPDTISAVKLLQLKNGSVEAYFRVTFTKLDSQQFIYLQDSIQQDLVVGKLPIVAGSNSVFETYLVPTAPPANVIVVSNSPTTLNVSWSAVDKDMTNGEVTGYLVMYRERLLISDPYNVFASYGYWEEVTGLKAGTRYVVRVLAYNQNGNGVASDVIEVSTFEMLPTSPPTSLKTQVINASAIFIEWTGVSLKDINGVPLGYHIYYTQRMSVLNNSLTVPFDSLYTTLTGLLPSITYIISVCAFNSAGEGPQETTSATTSHTAPISPPGSLSVTYRALNTLVLSWASESKDLDGYVLKYRVVQQDSKEVFGSFVHERRFSAAVLWYTVNNLESNTKYMFTLAGYNHQGNGPSISIVAETCKCPERVYSNYYLKAPYVYRPSTRNTGQLSGIFPEIIKDMIKQVCGSCSGLYSETLVDFSTNGKYGFAGKQNLDRVVEDIDNFTDVSFPMSTNPVQEKTIKAEFISIMSYPGAVFIVKEETLGERVMTMIIEILRVWPIFLIDMAFIIISGAIVWALEQWANRERDFSSLGLQGVKQGFYWAYVTQTTVGYGDFVPKSVRARSFAIVWMVVSVITASLLTGALTTAFTAVQVKEVNTIYGVQVAALHNSIEERIAILRNGKVDSNIKFTATRQLVDALMSGDVSGILLDAYSAGREKQYLKSLPLRPIFSINYPRTFGVVVTSNLANVKNELDAYVITNQAYIVDTLERYTQKMMPKGPRKSFSLFDPNSVFMRTSITFFCISWVVFAILGYVISLRCRKSEKTTICPEENVKLMSWKLDLDELRQMCGDFLKEYVQRTNQMDERFVDERVNLCNDKGAYSLRFLDQQMKGQYDKQLRRKNTRRKLLTTAPVGFDGDTYSPSIDHFKFTNFMKPEKIFATKETFPYKKKENPGNLNAVFALNV